MKRIMITMALAVGLQVLPVLGVGTGLEMGIGEKSPLNTTTQSTALSTNTSKTIYDVTEYRPLTYRILSFLSPLDKLRCAQTSKRIVNKEDRRKIGQRVVFQTISSFPFVTQPRENVVTQGDMTARLFNQYFPDEQSKKLTSIFSSMINPENTLIPTADIEKMIEELLNNRGEKFLWFTKTFEMLKEGADKGKGDYQYAYGLTLCDNALNAKHDEQKDYLKELIQRASQDDRGAQRGLARYIAFAESDQIKYIRDMMRSNGLTGFEDIKPEAIKPKERIEKIFTLAVNQGYKGCQALISEILHTLTYGKIQKVNVPGIETKNQFFTLRYFELLEALQEAMKKDQPQA